ncbi:hypothetical protein BsWGS_08572 [Bradybaena similaris]
MRSPGPPDSKAPDDGVPRWRKHVARACSVLAGLVAMITGLIVAISLSPLCIVSGLLLMLLGFVVTLLEAPCCCQFVSCFQRISEFSERRTYWHKALAYSIPAILSPILCFYLTTLFGSGLLIISGVVYGLIALAKRRADRQATVIHSEGRDVEMLNN